MFSMQQMCLVTSQAHLASSCNTHLLTLILVYYACCSTREEWHFLNVTLRLHEHGTRYKIPPVPFTCVRYHSGIISGGRKFLRRELINYIFLNCSIQQRYLFCPVWIATRSDRPFRTLNSAYCIPCAYKQIMETSLERSLYLFHFPHTLVNAA